VDEKAVKALDAGLKAYCEPTCAPKFRVAKAVVATILSDRLRDEDRTFRWGDRWFALLGAVIAGMIALFGTAATIIFGRAERRSERLLRVLIDRLSIREGVRVAMENGGERLS
jgi:predicted NBD/HSP70 family sugar kinase